VAARPLKKGNWAIESDQRIPSLVQRYEDLWEARTNTGELIPRQSAITVIAFSQLGYSTADDEEPIDALLAIRRLEKAESLARW